MISVEDTIFDDSVKVVCCMGEKALVKLDDNTFRYYQGSELIELSGRDHKNLMRAYLFVVEINIMATDTMPELHNLIAVATFYLGIGIVLPRNVIRYVLYYYIHHEV